MKTKPQQMISVPLELLRLLLPDEQINALTAFAASMTITPTTQPAAKAPRAKKAHGNAGKKAGPRKSTKEWLDLLATRKVRESRTDFAKRIGTTDAYLYQLLKKFPEITKLPAWND